MTMIKAASVVVSRRTMSSNCRRFLFTNTDAMKRHDPYAQLGLTWGATTTEIKEAYHKKAREYHPDVNRENPHDTVRKFQQVQSAYQKLIKGFCPFIVMIYWRNGPFVFGGMEIV